MRKQTLNSQLSILNSQFSILNSQFSILNSTCTPWYAAPPSPVSSTEPPGPRDPSSTT